MFKLFFENPPVPVKITVIFSSCHCPGYMLENSGHKTLVTVLSRSCMGTIDKHGQRAVHDKSYVALASVLGSSYATYKKTYGIKQHLAPEIVNFGIKCRGIEWHFGIENLKFEVKMLWH